MQIYSRMDNGGHYEKSKGGLKSGQFDVRL